MVPRRPDRPDGVRAPPVSATGSTTGSSERGDPAVRLRTRRAETHRQSFATIRAETDPDRLPADVAQVTVRMIHACGEVDRPAETVVVVGRDVGGPEEELQVTTLDTALDPATVDMRCRC